MKIREGKESDAAAMAEIYNHYVRTSPVIFSDRCLTAGEMADKLRRLGVGSRFPFLIAGEGGNVVGYAYAHLWQPDPFYDRTWELTMYLDAQACGKGLGSRMLAMLIDECRRRGAHTLVSCVTEGNSACERMHDRAGFFLAGRMPEVGCKFGNYYADVIYQLML